jgi:hypothetical protein
MESGRGVGARHNWYEGGSGEVEGLNDTGLTSYQKCLYQLFINTTRAEVPQLCSGAVLRVTWHEALDNDETSNTDWAAEAVLYAL